MSEISKPPATIIPSTLTCDKTPTGLRLIIPVTAAWRRAQVQAIAVAIPVLLLFSAEALWAAVRINRILFLGVLGFLGIAALFAIAFLWAFIQSLSRPGEPAVMEFNGQSLALSGPILREWPIAKIQAIIVKRFLWTRCASVYIHIKADVPTRVSVGFERADLQPVVEKMCAAMRIPMGRV